MKEDYMPVNGNFVDSKGEGFNLVDLLGGGVPVGNTRYNPTQFMPNCGLIIGSDGALYDLRELVKNFSGAGGSGGSAIDYSSTEQDTGAKWIDGKPIYQITLGDGKTNLSGSIDISKLNADTVVDISALGSDNAGNGYPRWVLSGVSANANRLIYQTNADTLMCEGGFFVWYITLKYTKTTD